MSMNNSPEQFAGIFKDPASQPAHGQSHSGVSPPSAMGTLGRIQFQVDELYRRIRGQDARPAGKDAFQISASMPGDLAISQSASGQVHREATMTRIYYHLQDDGSSPCDLELYVDGFLEVSRTLGVNYFEETVNIPCHPGESTFYWLITDAGVGQSGLTITHVFE